MNPPASANPPKPPASANPPNPSVTAHPPSRGGAPNPSAPSAPLESPESGESSERARSADPEAALRRLLARLHQRLERHPPEDLLVLARDELEEREIKAYADGWRDAVATYESARERAGARPGPPRLRLVHRESADRGAPPDPVAAQAPDPAEPPDQDPAATADQNHAAPPDRNHAATPDAASPPAPRGDASRPAAGLVPKNPSSRVPTIPRLGPPRSLGKRVRHGPAGEPPRSRGRPGERDPEEPSPSRPDG
ncbi:hypothetical protein AB0P17_02950 [Streptomyces sp. NPDC088124]|uniref:hypothetical protein n=1 Tax=Streptomyces sp. NPDC088124 TaxID=3154654 RepID=UPI003439A736